MIARIAIAVALVGGAGSAAAAPKSADARAQFDKGVAAYTKGDYAAAAEALGASFVIEADAETLFAWAQTERKLGHCDRAMDLYKKLLAMNLPVENKKAVQVQIDECKVILAEKPKTEPKVEPKVDKPKTEPKVAKIEPKPKAEPKTKPEAKLKPEPPPEAPPAPPPIVPVEPTPVQPPPIEPKSEGRAWWKDPVGGALVGAGAIGIGLGIVFLVQGSAAESDKQNAMSYPEYESFANRAESRGRLGVISLVVGGGLAAGGVYWYVSHKSKHETAVTTVVVPSGVGIGLSGRF